jgi:hypothetical protein
MQLRPVVAGGGAWSTLTICTIQTDSRQRINVIFITLDHALGSSSFVQYCVSDPQLYAIHAFRQLPQDEVL